jgi:hypothetical protein
MKMKTKSLSIITIVAIAAVAVSLALSTQLNANAQTTQATSVADNVVQNPTSSPADNASNVNGGHMGSNGFRGGSQDGVNGSGMMTRDGNFSGPGGYGQRGHIQVSSEYIANVTNIAKADTDVQNLLNNGYNITSVRPVISTTIDGNGNVVTKASNAELVLQSTTDKVTVIVNLDQAKVIKIVTP